MKDKVVKVLIVLSIILGLRAYSNDLTVQAANGGTPLQITIYFQQNTSFNVTCSNKKITGIEPSNQYAEEDIKKQLDDYMVENGWKYPNFKVQGYELGKKEGNYNSKLQVGKDCIIEGMGYEPDGNGVNKVGMYCETSGWSTYCSFPYDEITVNGYYGSGGSDGGGKSNQITSIIFIPEGSPKPKGFTHVEDEIYKKTTNTYEILIYVVYYKPPSTIGNLNIQ